MTIRERLSRLVDGPELKDLRLQLDVLQKRNERLVNQAETSVSEAIPDLQFKDGKLSEDSEAAIALKALTDVQLANKVVPLELLYQQYKIEGKNDEALAAARAQVGILARAIQVRVSTGIESGVQYHFGAEYQRMVADIQGFRGFLRDHFGQDLSTGEALNTPLLETAKIIMLRGRS
jgi:hypothetical protein